LNKESKTKIKTRTLREKPEKKHKQSKGYLINGWSNEISSFRTGAEQAAEKRTKIVILNVLSSKLRL
jgi:hypothetical protein